MILIKFFIFSEKFKNPKFSKIKNFQVFQKFPFRSFQIFENFGFLDFLEEITLPLSFFLFFSISTFTIVEAFGYSTDPEKFIGEIIDEANDILNSKDSKEIKAKKTILTNLHVDLDYLSLKNKLPKNIVPAYDGLSFNF